MMADTNAHPAVKEISFSNGDRVALDADELVVFVGGNNVGKSSTLKDIRHLIGGNQRHDNRETVVIKEVQMYNRDPTTVINLYAQGTKMIEGREHRIIQGLPILDVLETYNQGHVARIMPYLIDSLDYSKLSSICSPSIEAIGSDRTNEANNPFQLLLHDIPLRSQFYEQCRTVFGAGPLIDALHGTPMATYWGIKPEGTTDPSQPHSTKIRTFPKLHDQGDGTKRVVAILASLLVRKKAMYFIDEPEIHLHPPQCVKLAKEIAKSARGCQMFISTHSIDFLHGLLDCTDLKFKIIRITREGNANKPFVLKPDDLRKMWNDSYLRYSKVLEGIFYNKVVLCEGDADCRFYQFVYDSRITQDQTALFCPVGGKAKFKQIAAPLCSIGLAPKFIIDLDGLYGSTLGDILKELHFVNQWKTIQEDLRQVKESIEASKEPDKISVIKQDLESYLSGLLNENATKDQLKKLKDLIPSPSAWADVKKKGVANFINIENKTGKPLVAPFESVNKVLLDCGILLVPVGELECWVNCAKGPKAVLQKMEKHSNVNDPIYDAVHDFLKGL